MSLKDIVAKLKAVDGITEEEIAELNKLGEEPSDDMSKKIKESEAKAKRILDEKKKIAEKYDELAAKLDEITSADLTESEKLSKALEKEQASRAKLEEELNGIKSEYSKTTRNYQLNELQGKIKFLDSIPNDMRKVSLQNAFADVDLADEDAVKSTFESYVKEHQSVIASDKPSGTGDNKSNVRVINGNKAPEDMSFEERQAVVRANRAKDNTLGI